MVSWVRVALALAVAPLLQIADCGADRAVFDAVGSLDAVPDDSLGTVEPVVGDGDQHVALSRCQSHASCVGIFQSKDGSWHFLRRAKAAFQQCCGDTCPEGSNVPVDHCVTALLAKPEAQKPKPSAVAADDACGHGQLIGDPASGACQCDPHWHEAGITDTLRFLQGQCSQFRCEDDEMCEEHLGVRGAACPIKGWNCYCGWWYAFSNGFAGWEPEDGSAKCMGVMYTFSLWASSLIRWLLMNLWRVFLPVSLALLPFGRKRGICDHHRPTLWNALRRCAGRQATCRGECVLSAVYGADSLMDDMAWTIYAVDLMIWTYLFCLSLFVVTELIWCIILWTLVIIMLILACVAAACVALMQGAGECAADCTCGACDCGACGGMDAECCFLGGFHVSPVEADVFYLAGPYHFDPILGYYGGHPYMDLSGTAGSTESTCCSACNWRTLCCPIAWLFYVFPQFPENAWGGLVGYVMGTHQRTPSHRLYTNGSNSVVEVLRMGWRLQDLHNNSGWRDRVYAFIMGPEEPQDSVGPEAAQPTDTGGHVYMDDGVARKVLQVGRARAVLIERSFALARDRCYQSSFDDYSENKCWICQSDNTMWDMWLSCRHLFCQTCSSQMLTRRMPCPLCRVSSATVLRGYSPGYGAPEPYDPPPPAPARPTTPMGSSHSEMERQGLLQGESRNSSMDQVPPYMGGTPIADAMRAEEVPSASTRERERLGRPSSRRQEEQARGGLELTTAASSRAARAGTGPAPLSPPRQPQPGEGGQSGGSSSMPAGEQSSQPVRSPQQLRPPDALPVSPPSNTRVHHAPQAAPLPPPQPEPSHSSSAVASRPWQVGAHSLAGTKPNDPHWRCQDSYLVLPMGGSRLLVGVFDGHGYSEHGRLAAETARHIFEREGARYIAAALSDEAAAALLVSMFELAHRALQQHPPVYQYAGTTATAAIVNTLTGVAHMAFVGDSRLIVVDSEGQVAFHTMDHVIDDAAAQRVVASGGEVREAEISGISARRVYEPGSPYPGIMMSRSLGDLAAHAIGLQHTPEVHIGIPFPPGSSLVLASDGVWEHVREPEAAKFCVARLAEGVQPAALAHALVGMSRHRWPPFYSDDISAIVVAAAPAGDLGAQVGIGGVQFGAARLQGFTTSTAGQLLVPLLLQVRPRRREFAAALPVAPPSNSRVHHAPQAAPIGAAPIDVQFGRRESAAPVDVQFGPRILKALDLAEPQQKLQVEEDAVLLWQKLQGEERANMQLQDSPVAEEEAEMWQRLQVEQRAAKQRDTLEAATPALALRVGIFFGPRVLDSPSVGSSAAQQ